MEYNFYNFNADDFENMIQAIVRKIFGLNMIVFGDGPDGGREAVVFQGKYNVPLNDKESWDGYWVVQAKYKSKSLVDDDDFTWIKSQFKGEMDKFKTKDRNKLPKNYLFFTNAKLTPVEDSGGRDKIEKIKKDYSDLIPNIMIYGYDDLKTFLDNNRDVATTYSSFILTGDILRELLNMLDDINKSYFNKEKYNYYDLIKVFLGKEFKEDMYPKLEQGGKKTDEVINLENVFIDMYANKDDLKSENKDEEKFVERCISIGNCCLKENKYINKFVIMGNFGNGKSTLTQFLCQVYRAHFLKNLLKDSTTKETKEFMRKYCKLIKEDVTCIRLPIKVELNDYAEWVSKQKIAKLTCSLLAYIEHILRNKSDYTISCSDLREIFKNLSLLFIFDGLDEVAASSVREMVIEQLKEFIEVELEQIQSDALTIITTRPQGYGYEFNKDCYQHLVISDLTKKDCMNYLHLLLKNIEPLEKKRKNHMERLKKALEDPIYSELMKTPLQATIMAILVKSGGDLPKDRYNLFDKYYRTIYDRERQKNACKLLNELPEKYYKDIHKIFGFACHKISEYEENTSASFTKEKFNNLIKNYIIKCDDRSENSNDIQYDITKRLLFIIEGKDSNIKFNIRAFQEYFSAIYYLNCKESLFSMRIRQIYKSSYWRNVLLFGIGYIINERDYLIDIFYTLCCELNGVGQDFEEISTEKICKLGSWFALDILNEGIFRNFRTYEYKFSTLLLGLFEIAPNSKHVYFTKLSDDIKKQWVSRYIEEMLSTKDFDYQLTTWYIAATLINYGDYYIADIADNYWPKNDSENFLLNFLYKKHLHKNDWFINRFLNAFTKESLDNFKIILDDNEFILCLLGSNNIVPEQVGLLIEQLFLNINMNPRRYNRIKSEYIESFKIRPLIVKEQKIEITENFFIKRFIYTQNRDEVNDMLEVFTKVNFLYMKSLLCFILKPDEENAKELFKHMISGSNTSFRKVKKICVNMGMFSENFRSINNKDELRDNINYISLNQVLLDSEPSEIVINKDNIVDFIKKCTGRSKIIRGDNTVLEIYEGFYKKYINEVKDDDKKYIFKELISVIDLIDALDDTQIDDLTHDADFISSIIDSFHNLRYSEICNAHLYLIRILPKELLFKLISEDEKIFNNSPVKFYSFILNKNIFCNVFNKLVDLSPLLVNVKDGLIIRIIVSIIIRSGLKYNDIQLERINFEELISIRYKNSINERLRLFLCILNPRISDDQCKYIYDEIDKMCKNEEENNIYGDLIKIFEVLNIRDKMRIGIIQKIYTNIVNDRYNLDLLGQYESFFKHVDESEYTEINENKTMERLELDKYLIDSHIF